MSFEYVVSALGFGVLPGQSIIENYKDEFKKALLRAINVVQFDIHRHCVNTKPTLSVLYNAYTEEKMIEEFKYYNNFDSRGVYADSGGLQILTAGKPLSEDIKNNIYKVQTYSDFALSFDVIPIKILSEKRTRNERSNYRNKMFMHEKHEESAAAAGVNLKQQCEAFDRLGAKTKAVMIVQGNNAWDLYTYYQQIEKQLGIKNYDYIGGLSPGGACMGSGVLESLERINATQLIRKSCHPNLKEQMHVLGLGSLSRIRPFVYLKKSGYIKDFPIISYDSSSHTSTFDYALVKLDGTCRSIGDQYMIKPAIKYFGDVYDYFEEIFKVYVDKDTFINIILGNDFKNFKKWKYSSIVSNAVKSKNDKHIMTVLLLKALYTYFQIANFVRNVEDIWNEKCPQNEGYSNTQPWIDLRKVQSMQDMKEWMDHWSGEVDSKRIKSSRDINKPYQHPRTQFA